MATYDSIHTGTAVDQAVERTLANKSKGDSSTPVYLNADGEAIAITKSTTPTEDDNKLITSGTMYTELAAKYNKADIATSTDLGTSTTLVPSQNAVKVYTDKLFSSVQPTVVAGTNIVKTGNELSVNPTGLMNPDELTGKRGHYGEYVVGYKDDVLEKVERAKHSTFDLSKFTVVGSPNITDDGIYTSNLAYNTLTNGFTLPVKWGDLKGKSWSIKFRAYGDGTNTTSNPFGYKMLNTNDELRIEWGNLYWYFRVGDSLDNKDSVFARRSFPSTAGMYDAILSFNIDAKTYFYKLINVETGEVYNSSTYTATETTSPELYRINESPDVYITWYSFAPNTRMDFKQFSITVDGVPVFSGNKTGIDVLKPDDFTPYGAIISDDGVFTRPSEGTGYLGSIIKSITLTSGKKYDIYLKATLREVASGRYPTLFDLYNNVSNASVIRLGFGSDGGARTPSLGAASADYNVWKLTLGTQYSYHVETDLATYAKLYINGTLAINNTTFTNSTNADNIRFGMNYRGDSYTGLLGSIDLNSVKIYENGNLIYQPLLRIPYNLSKDGKKIVDEYYRDRVTSEVEQATFTPYYTLQSENKGNYITIGSPTISNDFVASGFSGSNYLIAPTWDLSKPFELYIPFKINSNYGSNANTILAYSKGVTDSERYNFGIDVQSLKLRLTNTVNGTSFEERIIGNTTLVVDTDYLVKIVYDLTKIDVYLSSDGGQTFNLEMTSTTTIYTGLKYPIIGRYMGTSPNYFNGSIDLNQFKVYIDGNLAYQAVIPPNYTMATNKPQDIIYMYQNGANKYIQRANLQLEEYGTCTGTTAVTFQKPFINDNYALTVPYSAKSKTGFTPNVGSGVTRDWKAKGFYSL